MDSPIIDIVPATPIQRGLLYVERSYAKGSLYHEQYVAKLTGPLDLDRLKTAWQKTVAAHTVLRTIFDWDGQNEPMQIVLRHYSAPFVMVEPRDENECTAFVGRDAQESFQFDTTPPHRLTLMKLNDQTYWLVFTYHHLLLDGSSISALFNYLARQYNQPSEVREINDYGAYSRWMQNLRQQENSIDAWRSYAQGATLPASLVQEDSNDQTRDYYQHMDREAVSRLIAAARTHHLTLNSIFQVVWAYTLALSREQSLVCAGSPTMVKPLDGSMDSVVGLCINTLPYILSFDRERSLVDIAKRHQQNWGGLIEHSRIGLAEIKKAIGYHHYGDPFDTILTYTDVRDRMLPELEEVDWRVLSHNEITQYSLSLDVVYDVHSLELKATYRDAYYDAPTISRLVRSFADNITLFIEHPDTIPHLRPHIDVEDVIIAAKGDENEATTEKIAEIWADVFGVDIELDSNFFDLGGDSISSLRIVSKLLEAGITVSMRDVFDSPTPRRLARVVSSTAIDEPVTPMRLPIHVEEKARQLYGDNISTVVRASSVQQGIIRRPSSKQNLYHDQSTFTYKGQLDPDLFEKAWNIAANKNDSMHLRYFSEDDTLYVCALKNSIISMQYLDLRDTPRPSDTIRHAIEDDLATPFNLQHDPLVRLRLYRTGDDTHVLFLSFHILVTDGWSFAFMMDDVFTAYEHLIEGRSFDLPGRRPTYVEYLQSLSVNDTISGRQHWYQYLRDAAGAKGVSISDFSNLEVVLAHLDEHETDMIQRFASVKRLSLNSVVQAAWATVNARQSEPVIFGATTSARLLHNVHYDNTVGLFFNDVPIIAHVEGRSIEQLANTIQRDFQTNLKYSYVSSYDIAEMLGRGFDEAPYDSLVVFENYPKMQEDSLKESRRGGVMNTDYWRRDMADIPITLYVEVRNGETDIKLSYNNSVVSREAARGRVDEFVRTLKTCTL
ncbi:MAG TPA: condensation domain-containing protein [Dongiaceae bacterium]|nr:condensation domain-containing protein [Dongiaceae bacterium]